MDLLEEPSLLMKEERAHSKLKGWDVLEDSISSLKAVRQLSRLVGRDD